MDAIHICTGTEPIELGKFQARQIRYSKKKRGIRMSLSHTHSTIIALEFCAIFGEEITTTKTITITHRHYANVHGHTRSGFWHCYILVLPFVSAVYIQQMI